MESGPYPDWMGQHREPVKLLLTRAEGTSYERFVHNMVEVEVEYTLSTWRCSAAWGRIFPCWTNPCTTIASGMMGGIFEIVIHDILRSRHCGTWINCGISTLPDG